MKKLDFIIISAILPIALSLYIFWHFNTGNDTSFVVITVDGIQTQKLLLADHSQDITIENQYGTNIIKISDDGAKMASADCGSQTCVHT